MRTARNSIRSNLFKSLTVLILLVSSQAFSSEPFLDPRSSALGGATVASGDGFSGLFFNPAGLAPETRGVVGLIHAFNPDALESVGLLWPGAGWGSLAGAFSTRPLDSVFSLGWGGHAGQGVDLGL